MLLHAGAGFPSGPPYTHWYLEPTVALTIVGLLGAYFLLTGPINRRYPGWETRSVSSRQRGALLGACGALLVALGPPLDDWSGYFLLSAHMLQHVILLMLVPPLILLGLPAWLLQPLTRNPLTNRLGYWLTRAPIAYALSALAMALWHVPVFYDAALEHELLHVMEHNTYLLTGMLAWWPVCGPLPAWPRLPPLLQCLYLFLSTVPGGILGSIITMGSVPIYDAYAPAPRIFGLDLETDQQIAGLMMWVGENTIYLLIITVIFFRWAAAEERKEQTRHPALT